MEKKRKHEEVGHALLPLVLVGIFIALASSVINLTKDASPTGFVVQDTSCENVACGFNSQCSQGQCVCEENYFDATCDTTPDVDEDQQGCTPSRVCRIY